MNSNIDFNELWLKQKTGEPDTKDLLVKLDKFKSANLKRLIITNLCLGATTLFIIFIWYYYQPQLSTTKIGIVLIIVAMLIYVIAGNQSLKHFRKNLSTHSNTGYLKELLAIQVKQKFMQTTMLNLYFILLSVGISLYMYEYTRRMTTFWGIFSYGITLTWILFNWFYLRPKQIKKQQAKLDDMIARSTSLNEQFTDSSQIDVE